MDTDELKRREIEEERRREESRRAKESARQELSDIKAELQGIINELDLVAQGIREDFEGIGNERCATGIDKVAENYRWAKKQLSKLD